VLGGAAGYELDASPIDIADTILESLTSTRVATGCTALVGAPIESNGRRYIATVRIDTTGPSIVYS
jgi:hypothetical protein